MRVAWVIRRGFSAPRLRVPEGVTERFEYGLGEPFAAVWERAAGCGAEYVLLVDDAVAARAADVRLLAQILERRGELDGLTLDSAALLAVYGMEPARPRPGTFPFTLKAAPALPAWFALLRAERWGMMRWATPEYFLLSQPQRRVARTGAPTLELDPVMWAGELMLRSAAALASDYAGVAHLEPAVPRQFQVHVPGAAWKPDAAGRRERPTFTIMTPSIRPDFLREAVQSVVEQTYPHWELRLAIDGPVEHNLVKIRAILREYDGDPRIHVEYQEHLGTGPTRKKLADAAEGDYLIGMDDDDRLAPRALERIAEEIERVPGAPLLRGGTKTFGLFEAYLSPRTRYMVGGAPNDIFEVNQPYVVRRDVMHALGGFEWDDQLKSAGEDSDLFLKADRAGLPVRLIDEPLYERRLSTLNQTLDCTAEECLTHVRNLYARHSGEGWSLKQIHFRDEGPMLAMVTVHGSEDEAAQLVCATRFMDFQKVGGRERMVVDLEITSLCNAVCTFCPREQMEREARFMSLETVGRIADSIRDEGAGPHVVLCGIAESTLHPELEAIVGLLSAAGASVGMTTNGWSLRPELVDRLTAAGLNQLNVSLNAFSAETHAAQMRLKGYERIVEACGRVAAERAQRWPELQLNVSFVVTSANGEEAVRFAEHWRGTGVTQVWLHNLTNRAGLIQERCLPGDMAWLAARFGGDPRVRVDLFPEEDGPPNLCRVARGIDFISVDGEMLLCAQDYEARHKFGRISHGSLAQLHHGKILRHLRGETSDTCAECTFCPPSFRGGRSGVVSIVQSGRC